MSNETISAPQVLFPVLVLSLAVALFLGFQTTLLMNDRSALQQAHQQQDQPLEQFAKVKVQVNALAIGTLRLSKQGNKDAETIIAALNKAGINVNDAVPGGDKAGTAKPAAETAPEQQ